VKSLKPASDAFFFSSESQKISSEVSNETAVRNERENFYMLEKLLESETSAGFCTPKVGINIKQYHNRTHIICAHIPPADRKYLSPSFHSHISSNQTQNRRTYRCHGLSIDLSKAFFFFFLVGGPPNFSKAGKICNKTGDWKAYQSEEWTSPKTWWFDDHDEHCSSETVSFTLRP
jgi:hypothetical protein